MFAWMTALFGKEWTAPTQERTGCSLAKLRYPRPGTGGEPAPDCFLRFWLDLSYYTALPQTVAKAKLLEKCILNFADGLDRCTTPRVQQLAELTDSAAIYLNCCKTDKGFSSQLLGLVPMSSEQHSGKIVSVVAQYSQLLRPRCAQSESCGLILEALHNAFRQEFPALEPLYQQKMAEHATLV